MNKSIFALMIAVGTGIFIGLSGFSWAQSNCPNLISVDLTFTKDFYNYGEPIGVTITVQNCSEEDLYVSNGFTSKKFYDEMRVVDSAGRQLLRKVKPEETNVEFPDAPPLPVILKNPGPYQVALQASPCELFPGTGDKSVITQSIDDLRDYYEIKFPGSFFAEVQVSPMILKASDLVPGSACYIDRKILGTQEAIKSEPQYIYTQGSTEVDIIPRYWLLAWKDGFYLFPDLAVTIWPEDGKTVDDYRIDTIRLNNDLAKFVWEMYSFLKRKHYLLAFFDKRKAINSLGSVQAGKEYSVVISGMFKNNTYFGGGEKIQVLKIFH